MEYIIGCYIPIIVVYFLTIQKQIINIFKLFCLKNNLLEGRENVFLIWILSCFLFKLQLRNNTFIKDEFLIVI